MTILGRCVSRSYTTIPEHDVQSYLDAVDDPSRPVAIISQVTVYEMENGLFIAQLPVRDDDGDIHTLKIQVQAQSAGDAWVFWHPKLSNGKRYIFERKLMEVAA